MASLTSPLNGEVVYDASADAVDSVDLAQLAVSEQRVAQLEQWVAELLLAGVSDVPMDEETVT